METERETAKKTARYKKEIEAHFNPYLFKILASAAKFCLDKTFKNIEVENIDYVKNSAEKGVVVYASNHKSYTDPLLLGLVLYNNRIKQPYYAAGRNMFNIWSNGLLKSMGAFSVDRSNKDIIYLNTLKDYIGCLINERKDILLYIEGRRSYDGKMKSPKLGILKAILESQNKDVFIIPTAVNYEQVLEDRVLTAIATKKNQRRFTDEVKELFNTYFDYYPAKKDGRRHYSSKAYVTFASPIKIRDYSEKRSDLKNLAWLIIKEIHSSKHHSSTSIVAAAALNASLGNNEAKMSDIEENILKNYSSLDGMMEEGFDSFICRNTVSVKGEIVSIKEPKILEYYANGLQ